MGPFFIDIDVVVSMEVEVEGHFASMTMHPVVLRIRKGNRFDWMRADS